MLSFVLTVHSKKRDKLGQLYLLHTSEAIQNTLCRPMAARTIGPVLRKLQKFATYEEKSSLEMLQY